MIKDLIMFFPPNLDVELAPVSGEYLMEYMDNIRYKKLLEFTEDINELSEGGIYDRL